MSDPVPTGSVQGQDESRRRSIDKNVSGALLLAFYAYIDPDKKRARESIDVANKVMDACGYPRVPDVV